MSRFLRAAALALASTTLVGVAAPRVADACGGCFVPPSSSTVVTGHRMVVAISPDQTTLWDQIQYAGDPAEFAWVLPVARGARIETSTAAFFEVLEAATQRTVYAPPVDCGGSDFGCGFARGLAEAGDGGFDAQGSAPNGDPVEVLHSGTVGPYETVTLATDEPGALNAWLVDHGFNVDPSTQPIIDDYVAEGFDFIALRLQPGQGVNQMTPVRVVTAGAGASLPLRMVAIGTGAETPIVLYVVGEGRYATQNFPDVHVATELVSWDFETSESNYAAVRKEALAAEGGRGFLTTYARKGPIFEDNFSDITFNSNGSLIDLYTRQLVTNAETDRLCVITPPSGNGRIVNPCPAGEPFDSPTCRALVQGEVDVRTLRCDGADDFATALVGMHADDVWITRLEANLPRAALDADLLLQAAAKQDPVSAELFASLAIHPEAACPQNQNNGAVFSIGKLGDRSRDLPFGQLAALALVAAGAGLVLRRASQRQKALARRGR